MIPEPYEVVDARTTRSTPERVLALLRSPSTWASWQPEILAARGPEPLAEGDAVEGRAKLLGFLVEGRSKVATLNNSYFEEDVIVGVRMRVTYQVEAVGKGCRVTRRLYADLPAGSSGRILSFFLKRRLKRMQAKVLDELVRQSEVA